MHSITEVTLHSRHMDIERICFLVIAGGAGHGSPTSCGSVALVCHHMDIGTTYYLPVPGGIPTCCGSVTGDILITCGRVHLMQIREGS